MKVEAKLSKESVELIKELVCTLSEVLKLMEEGKYGEARKLLKPLLKKLSEASYEVI